MCVCGVFSLSFSCMSLSPRSHLRMNEHVYVFICRPARNEITVTDAAARQFVDDLKARVTDWLLHSHDKTLPLAPANPFFRALTYQELEKLDIPQLQDKPGRCSAVQVHCWEWISLTYTLSSQTSLPSSPYPQAPPLHTHMLLTRSHRFLCGEGGRRLV